MLNQNFIQKFCPVFLFFILSPALADTLPFAEIVRLATTTHPAVLSKKSSSGEAKANLDAASWSKYPTPTIEAGDDANGVRTSTLRIEQTVYDFGRTSAGIHSAEARYNAAEIAINETRVEVAQKVISAYVDALRQKGRKDILSKEMGQLNSLFELITRRVQAGASPHDDLDLAQSRLYQTDNELSSSAQGLSTALDKLSQLASKHLDDVAALDAEKAFEPVTREEALEQARNYSPNLRRLKLEETTAEADARLKRASYKPKLVVRYDNDNASGSLNGGAPYSTKRIYLAFQSQTGAGLSALSEAQSAEAHIGAAEQARENALRDLNETVMADWNEFIASSKRRETATHASEVSKQVYESYVRLYTTGKKTWLDVLNIVRESAQSDIAAVDVNAQMLGSALRLQLETGKMKLEK